MARRTAGDTVDEDAPLMDAGLDSHGAVELRDLLNTSSGLALPDTLVFDAPTPRKIAAYLENGTLARQVAPVPQLAQGRDLLLAGQSVALPSGAESPFATNLLFESGSDAIREVPFGRWSVKRLPAMPKPVASRARRA